MTCTIRKERAWVRLRDRTSRVTGSVPGVSASRGISRTATACAMLVVVGSSLSAQTVTDSARIIRVQVRDAVTSLPVAGAKVRSLTDTLLWTVTNGEGTGSLVLRWSSRVLVTARLGFAPDTTHVADQSWAARHVSIVLLRNAQALEELRVERENPATNAMMREFDQRRARKSGGASFLGPEELARQPHARLTDFLRRGVQGVQFIDSGGVLLPVSSRGGVLRINQNRPTAAQRAQGREYLMMERVMCVLRIVVDGIPKEWGFDLATIEKNDVYGVEVYAGPATLPAQYQSMGRDGFCGLILIWTKAK